MLSTLTKEVNLTETVLNGMIFLYDLKYACFHHLLYIFYYKYPLLHKND